MRVLVATDFSPSSDEAIREGFARARALGGEVAVCHVMPDISQLQGMFPPEYALGATKQDDHRPKIVAAVEEQVRRLVPDAGAHIEIRIDEGAPYAGILSQAEKWDAETIVVGSGGKAGLERLVLGSVAARVVRYAHCPVLVARPTAGRAVLVATDLSDPSLPAIQAGAQEAKWRQASRLVVLHVGEVASAGVASAFMGAVPVVLPEDLLQVRRKAAHDLIQSALERFGVEAQIEVIDGDPATEIVALAESLPAGLLVVGTRGRTGLSRVVLGSVAERLVRDAPCSVLAVRLRAS